MMRFTREKMAEGVDWARLEALISAWCRADRSYATETEFTALVTHHDMENLDHRPAVGQVFPGCLWRWNKWLEGMSRMEGGITAAILRLPSPEE